jgi:hypothetical protein
MRFRNKQRPARTKHPPHFPECGQLEVRWKVVHEQARDHHVELARRETQGLSRTDLELTVAGPRSLMAGVTDHLLAVLPALFIGGKLAGSSRTEHAMVME